jgi:hypothetical protein
MLRWAVLLLVGISSIANAQYFGRNKPHYRKFDFSVSRSAHYEYYHYLRSDSTLKEFAGLAEGWYSKHKKILKDTIPFRNPLILYSSPADFQQTTAIQGTLGAGTGGVTEAMKNRVVMPLMETKRQTDHVLGHELVHAFQYSMMRQADSVSIYTADVPLWMVEGMAEYMSLGNNDPQTAMWMRDAVQNNDIPTLDKMSKNPLYFPYRYGQAFWAYVAGKYSDTIIRPLFMNAAKNGYQYAIKTVLKTPVDSFSKQWASDLKAYYGKYQSSRTAVPIAKSLINELNGGAINVSPSISPDGKYVAFFSEKEVFSINLYIAEVETGKIIKRLSTTRKNTDIDEISFLESGGAWSPDSRQFAFVVYEKGRNLLFVTDIASGKIIHKYRIPGLDFFSNPAWSPDSKKFALTGTIEGTSDIYVYEPGNGVLQNVTSDQWSDIHPSWNSAGDRIYFSSDRDLLRSGNEKFKICEYDLLQRTSKVLDILPLADNMNPIAGPGDTCVYFISTHQGFRDIFMYSLNSHNTYRLTNLFTGVSGITEMSPALSVARNINKLVFSFYNKRKYSIYALEGVLIAPQALDTATDALAGVLPPADRISDPVKANIPLAVDPKKEKYRSHFKLDFIGNSGVGVVAGRYGAGLAGGVNALFSDIVGNNMLLAGLSMNGRLQDIAGSIAYINQKNILQYGAMISHIPYRAATSSYAFEKFNTGMDSIMVDRYSTDIIRVVEDQVGIFAFLPISQSRRFEAGTSYSFYKFSQERINDYYKDGRKIHTNTVEMPSIDPYGYFSVNGAFVLDNSTFGIASPMKGKRLRYEVTQYFNGINVTSLIADQRGYMYIKPIALAIRGLYAGRYGTDANTIKLMPLFIGYPTLVRGFDAYTLYEANRDKITFESLSGSQMVIANGEVRLPFTGPRRVCLIPSNYLFSELALFIDGGAAWRNTPMISGETNEIIPATTKLKPVFSTGLSLRVNILGMLVLEPYYALPFATDNLHTKGIVGLNFSPGW